MRIVLTLAAGLIALAAITAAFGHSEPVRFNPAPGQVLDTSPQRVDGWFTQQMRRSGTDTSIAVYPVMSGGMPGDPVSGETVIDDSNRRHMYAELTGDLMPGQYVVSWSALSDEDDHPDSRCFRFFFLVRAPRPPPRGRGRPAGLPVPPLPRRAGGRRPPPPGRRRGWTPRRSARCW